VRSERPEAHLRQAPRELYCRNAQNHLGFGAGLKLKKCAEAKDGAGMYRVMKAD
jgi:hypothetical protein